MAGALVAAGAAVYAPDHAGHGLSEGGRAHIGHIEDMVTDLGTVAKGAAEDHPGRPVGMIGHSTGGVNAVRYVQRDVGRLGALVLSGPVIGGSPAIFALLRWTRSRTSRSTRPPSRATRPSGPHTPRTRGMRERGPTPALEYKADHVLRERDRPALVWLLEQAGPLHGRAHVSLVDKAFFVVGKVVDLLVAGVSHTPDMGLYPDARIRTSRRRSTARDPRRTATSSGLDPAIVRAVARWGPGPVAIVHDETVSLTGERLGRLFPAGRPALTFADSRTDARVQVRTSWPERPARPRPTRSTAGVTPSWSRCCAPFVDPCSIMPKVVGAARP